MSSKKWKEVKLGDICTLHYGKALTAKNRIDGDIPVYSSAGITGRHNSSLVESEGIIVGRKGSVGTVYYSSSPFFCIDTAYYVLPSKEYSLKYLFYRLKSLGLEALNEDSAVPGLNRETAYSQIFLLPPYDEQLEIESILSSLDDKIEQNRRINDNLAHQAQAIFKSWFVNFEPWGGEQPTNWVERHLGNYVEIKRGGSPRPIQDFLSDKGLRWLKISDVTALQTPFVISIKEHIKESGLKKTVFLQAGSLVLSNSATPGIPKILCIDTCIHDGWLYFPTSYFSNEYLYLFFTYIRKTLVALGNGSVFTNLKTDILKNYPVVVPDNDVLQRFDELVVPLFRAMENYTIESAKLSTLRDTLLPKLMSGEMDVSEVIL